MGARLWGYCIRGREDPPPGGTISGIDGAPVWVIPSGRLALWGSTLAQSTATVEHLRQYNRVVGDALRTATPLPLRFGTTFAGEEEARAVLERRADEFETSLQRLAGRVEMGLRVAHQHERAAAERSAFAATPLQDEPGSAATPGRRYLETRRRELALQSRAEQEAEQVLSALEHELRDLGVPSVRTVLPRAPLLGSVAHLVQRSQVRPYRERVAELQRSRSDLRIVASGPWAPYSFV